MEMRIRLIDGTTITLPERVAVFAKKLHQGKRKHHLCYLDANNKLVRIPIRNISNISVR